MVAKLTCQPPSHAVYNADFIKRETETIREITVTRPFGAEAPEASMEASDIEPGEMNGHHHPRADYRDPLPYTFHYIHGENIYFRSSSEIFFFMD